MTEVLLQPTPADGLFWWSQDDRINRGHPDKERQCSTYQDFNPAVRLFTLQVMEECLTEK
jgi:hypothetical protein